MLELGLNKYEFNSACSTFLLNTIQLFFDQSCLDMFEFILISNIWFLFPFCLEKSIIHQQKIRCSSHYGSLPVVFRGSQFYKVLEEAALFEQGLKYGTFLTFRRSLTTTPTNLMGFENERVSLQYFTGVKIELPPSGNSYKFHFSGQSLTSSFYLTYFTAIQI